MTNDILILAGTAAAIGFVHTITGPDHYLPFIVMSKARNWTLIKTIWITFLCGLGHVGSSIIMGIIGIVAGYGVSKLEGFEGARGNWAAWAFIIFGFAYFLWGIWRAVKNRPHKHPHIHKDGIEHVHEHKHGSEHSHTHNKSLTPWILFLIFVLGPCEPLIPLLMYPAAEHSLGGIIFVTAVFSLLTIVTMLTVVILTYVGINFIQLQKMERYMHAIAGATICLSGCAIVFLGL